ncbi:MAG: ferritin family protein [Myxococcales bacterium]|nr:ferritin family protein [Myxococcales bacterium]
MTIDKERLLAAVKTMALGEVYSFAIDREREAQLFYKQAQDAVKNLGAKSMLAELYQEEVQHEQMLLRARKAEKIEIVGQARGFVDLGLADMMPDVRVRPTSTPQEILMAAIKKEAFAESFYLAAEEGTDNPDAKKLFAHLADEENQHKSMLETWYDDHILTNN